MACPPYPMGFIKRVGQGQNGGRDAESSTQKGTKSGKRLLVKFTGDDLRRLPAGVERLFFLMRSQELG